MGPCSQYFYQVVCQNDGNYFLAPGVYLQARDCIGNTWSYQPIDNLVMSQRITYMCYVQQGTAEEVDYKRYSTCDCDDLSENTRHILECQLLAHSCSLDDLLQFNEAGKQCGEQSKTAV